MIDAPVKKARRFLRRASQNRVLIQGDGFFNLDFTLQELAILKKSDLNLQSPEAHATFTQLSLASAQAFANSSLSNLQCPFLHAISIQDNSSECAEKSPNSKRLKRIRV